MEMLRYNDIEFSSRSKYVKASLEFGDMSVSKNDVSYVDRDGISCQDVYFNAGKLTLKGWINASNEMEFDRLRRKLIHSINPKKEIMLYYYNGMTKRIAPVYASLVWGSKYGTHLQYFTVYFDIPGYYWLNMNQTTRNLLSREKLIKSPFQFPLMFSRRVMKNVIMNNGDENTGFKITFTVKISSFETPDTHTIIFKNNTTGKQLALTCSLNDGEVIVFDTDNATIESDIQGNMIKYIEDNYDGIMSEFFEMEVGNNELECTLIGERTEASAILTFNEKYRGI